MPNSVNVTLFQYADDSALLVSGKQLPYVTATLTENLKQCHEWLVDNKLSMHPGKTELILFGSKSKLKKVKDFELDFEGHITKASTCVNYLGLNLDQNLSGENTVIHIVKKVNSRLRFMYRQASFFDTETKKILVSALVLPYFDYSISSWHSGLSRTLKSKLQLAQNRVIRFLLNYSSRTHLSQDDFRKANLLNLEDRAKQLRLNHMFNVYNNVCPLYMKKFFTRLSDMYTYNTRGNRHNYHVPIVNTVTKTTFFYNGIIDWNSLPVQLKVLENRSNFKKTVKNYLKTSTSYF